MKRKEFIEFVENKIEEKGDGEILPSHIILSSALNFIKYDELIRTKDAVETLVNNLARQLDSYYKQWGELKMKSKNKE